MTFRTPILVSLVACLASSCATGGRNVWRDEKRKEGYRLELVVGGVALPVVEHRGRSYVAGQNGLPYAVRFVNDSPRRVEVVVAVDGRDVIDGRPFDPDRRGYVVAPFSAIDIEGWRTSLEAVAAFRFTSREDAYASRMGTPGELGRIEAEVFTEKEEPRGPIVLRSPTGSETLPPAPGSLPEAELRAAGAPKQVAADRGRLGTQFGERVGSRAMETEFVRDSGRPTARLFLQYDDAEGLCRSGLKDFCEPQRPPLLPMPSPPSPPPDERFSNPPPGWEGRLYR
ncbi:MAG: hypothetical protein GYA21_11465 [Myxococcales bacterium]|nr:hypothetical protein [Myxococcales bacterium]